MILPPHGRPTAKALLLPPADGRIATIAISDHQQAGWRQLTIDICLAAEPRSAAPGDAPDLLASGRLMLERDSGARSRPPWPLRRIAEVPTPLQLAGTRRSGQIVTEPAAIGANVGSYPIFPRRTWDCVRETSNGCRLSRVFWRRKGRHRCRQPLSQPAGSQRQRRHESHERRRDDAEADARRR